MCISDTESSHTQNDTHEKYHTEFISNVIPVFPHLDGDSTNSNENDKNENVYKHPLKVV